MKKAWRFELVAAADVSGAFPQKEAEILINALCRLAELLDERGFTVQKQFYEEVTPLGPTGELPDGLCRSCNLQPICGSSHPNVRHCGQYKRG